MNPLRLRAPLLALLALPLAPTRAAEDPCAAFSWDVHHERELFREQPVDIASGRALADAPVVTPDRLAGYALQVGFGFVDHLATTSGGAAVYLAATIILAQLGLT